MVAEPSPESDMLERRLATAGQNFAVGVFLSGVPLWVYLSLSIDMTDSTWATVGTVRLAAAIAIPLLCGLLAIVFREKVTTVLSGILESVHLPF